MHQQAYTTQTAQASAKGHNASEDEMMIAHKALTLAAVKQSSACPVLPCSSLTGIGFQR